MTNLGGRRKCRLKKSRVRHNTVCIHVSTKLKRRADRKARRAERVMRKAMRIDSSDKGYIVTRPNFARWTGYSSNVEEVHVSLQPWVRTGDTPLAWKHVIQYSGSTTLCIQRTLATSIRETQQDLSTTTLRCRAHVCMPSIVLTHDSTIKVQYTMPREYADSILRMNSIRAYAIRRWATTSTDLDRDIHTLERDCDNVKDRILVLNERRNTEVRSYRTCVAWSDSVAHISGRHADMRFEDARAKACRKAYPIHAAQLRTACATITSGADGLRASRVRAHVQGPKMVCDARNILGVNLVKLVGAKYLLQQEQNNLEQAQQTLNRMKDALKRLVTFRLTICSVRCPIRGASSLIGVESVRLAIQTEYYCTRVPVLQNRTCIGRCFLCGYDIAPRLVRNHVLESYPTPFVCTACISLTLQK
jgi:hypothetical protein